MADADDFLLSYDSQLRTVPEAVGALAVTRLGPLWLATFSGGRGFVTYRHPSQSEAALLPGLVAPALSRLRRGGPVTESEWKTRGHDRVPGLHQALADHGFVPGEPESIMIGRAELLAVDVPLPAGVTLRRVSDEASVRAVAAMQDAVFASSVADAVAADMMTRLAAGNGTELWVAEADGQVISTGRLEPVAGTDFAGIWGGATLEAWRGRGIYRALTSARARSALAAGKTLLQSDSTEYSRPILERSGMVKVSTTTPYVWGA